MPRRPTRKKRLSREERRDKIVDAALRVFSRRGFRGATTRELARAARITEVTLFRYFPSKERLFRAVIDKYSILAVLRSEMIEAAEQLTARQALDLVAERLLNILKQREDLIRLVLSESAVNPRQAQMFFRQGPARFFRDLARLLSTYRERGEVRDVDLVMASRAILGVFFTLFLTQEIFLGKQTEPIDLSRAAEHLTDILWNGLRPRDTSRKGARRR